MLFADGSKCVSLDNDIARLECFDEVYRQASTNTLTPEEAIQALADLIAIDAPHGKLEIGRSERPCEISVIYTGFLYTNFRPRPYLMTSSVYLPGVERIGEWRGIRGAWSKEIEGIGLFTDRHTTGSWDFRLQSVYGGPANVSGIDFWSIKPTRYYEGRDAALYLLVPDYAPDRAKVEKALWDAVLACGGGGG